ncbi:insulinase family protein [Dactylosporangium sp. NPDC051485]|uniref:insulinase family protein n=1 Tax=Dactylosporangium sp. NPDC051485 TaxID=3154846 RepID=UPI0034299B27
MSPAAAWAQTATPRNRVCTVRAHTSPLVELRIRWDHPGRLKRGLAADRVLAERVMDLASSARSGVLAASHLTAHANDHRFGIAASCWRDGWSDLLQAILALLTQNVVSDQQAAVIGRRTTRDLLHRRNGLDTVADRECLRILLGDSRPFDTEDAIQASVTAKDVAEAQHRLRTTRPLLVLVGDLDPQPVAELAASLLDRAHPEPGLIAQTQHESAGHELGGCARRVWHVTTRDDRSACRLATAVPNQPQHERVIADIAAHLIGDPSTGLLTDRLRTQLGWSYDVRCQIDDMGLWRVLTCKAIVASHNADRAGAEMRTIAGAELVRHIQAPGMLEQARAAVAASRLLVNASPSGWASDLVKSLAAGVHADDAVRVVEQIRSVSISEMSDFIRRSLVDVDQRMGDRR